MNFKRIGRIFICLLLVCCLLIQASPIKAHATGVGEVIIAGFTNPVVAPIVIGSILVGLGVCYVEKYDVFENLVNFVEDKLESAGKVVNGMIDTWVVSDGETQTYTVSEELVKDVFDATYESGLISYSDASAPVLSSGSIFRTGPLSYYIPYSDVNVFVFYSGSVTTSCEIFFASLEPFSYYVENNPNSFATKDASSRTYDDVTFYYTSFACPSDNWTASHAAPQSVFKPEFISGVLTGEISYSEGSVSAVEGLDAAKLAAPDILSIEDAYKNWSDNKVMRQDGDDNKQMPYWPIAPMDSFEATANTTQEEVWAGLHDYTTTVLDNWDVLLNGLTAIKNGILNIPKSISNGVAKLQAAIDALPQAFENVISEVKAAIYTIPDAFSNWMTQLINLLTQLWDTVSNIFTIVRDAVLEALSLAFALDPAYMEAEFNSLISDFEFFGSMVDFGRGVVDVFYGIGSKPPILYIDLGAAEGEVLWGDRVVFLDLSWYERYKPYGDALISSFLWAFFGWRLLHHIPGLINGSSGIVPHFK